MLNNYYSLVMCSYRHIKMFIKGSRQVSKSLKSIITPFLVLILTELLD